MTQTIPTVDQKLINKYFPGQVVKSSQRSVQGIIRGYSMDNDVGMFISTLKGRQFLINHVFKMHFDLKYELRMKTEGNHFICILQS